MMRIEVDEIMKFLAYTRHGGECHTNCLSCCATHSVTKWIKTGFEFRASSISNLFARAVGVGIIHFPRDIDVINDRVVRLRRWELISAARPIEINPLLVCINSY